MDDYRDADEKRNARLQKALKDIIVVANMKALSDKEKIKSMKDIVERALKPLPY